jgi:hypothetical protein
VRRSRREDVADEPLALLEVKAVTVVGDDPGRVLPAMLDRDEAVVDLANRALRSITPMNPHIRCTLRESTKRSTAGA